MQFRLRTLRPSQVLVAVAIIGGIILAVAFCYLDDYHRWRGMLKP